MLTRTRIGLTVLAATAVLAGCTGEPAASPSASATTPSAAVSSEPPSAATSAAPTPSAASPSATPSASPSAAAIPSSWEPLNAADAGIKTDEVDEIIGAWSLPAGGIASVVKYANTTGSSDPDEVFELYFGDGAGLTHETRETSGGDPVLVVNFVPEAGDGGDSQTYLFVITPEEITSALISGTPDTLHEWSDDLWQFVRESE